MAKTKIDWCDEVWNPVWGCLNNCPYCYARRYAKRFGGKVGWKEAEIRWGLSGVDFKPGRHIDPERHELRGQLKNFKPTWLESNFQKKFPKKSKRIFIDSMSDIKYWKPEWIERVLDKIREHPQHTFMFLTQDNDIYADYEFPENCWLGYTVPTDYDYMDKSLYAYCDYPKMFFSIEPILSEINFIKDHWIKWVIIGAETGGRSRREKVIPKRKWIENIVEVCRDQKTPVFLKGSLKDIWGKKLIQEFPG